MWLSWYWHITNHWYKLYRCNTDEEHFWFTRENDKVILNSELLEENDKESHYCIGIRQGTRGTVPIHLLHLINWTSHNNGTLAQLVVQKRQATDYRAGWQNTNRWSLHQGQERVCITRLLPLHTAPLRLLPPAHDHRLHEVATSDGLSSGAPTQTLCSLHVLCLRRSECAVLAWRDHGWEWFCSLQSSWYT